MSAACRRTSGSPERTTRTPSSRPMRSYICRQKSATFPAFTCSKVRTSSGPTYCGSWRAVSCCHSRETRLAKSGENCFCSLLANAKFKRRSSPRVPVAQDRDRLARVVIAVVIEKDDFAPDLLLQAAGGLDLCEKKPARKNSARLLAEANDRRRHSLAASALAKIVFCSTNAKAQTLRQPIGLYQR